jgi:hypothetical protein
MGHTGENFASKGIDIERIDFMNLGTSNIPQEGLELKICES